jgi:hypothetical protein
MPVCRLSFQAVEQLYLFQGKLRPDGVILQSLFKFPLRMCPTVQKKYALLGFINIICAIVVTIVAGERVTP